MIKSWKRSSFVMVSVILLVYLFVGGKIAIKEEDGHKVVINLPPIRLDEAVPPPKQPEFRLPHDPKEEQSAVPVAVGTDPQLAAHPMWPHNLDRAWEQFSAYYATLSSNCSGIDALIAQGQSHTWDRKFFFYQCHGMCGGFGDRLRGALTVFYLAVLGGNCFGMDWRMPVGIDKYFDRIPLYTNALNCRACRHRSMHAIDNFLNVITPHSMPQWASPAEEIITVGTNSFQWHQVVNDAHFKDSLENNFPYLVGLTPYELAHLGLRLIFSIPSEMVKKPVEALRKQIVPGSLTIGVQVRLNEGRYGPSNGENFKFQFTCITKVLSDLCIQNVDKSSARACTYFVTGDLDYNDEVTLLQKSLTDAMAGNNISVHLFKSPQSPVHLDRTNGNAEAHLKTFIDWEFLKEMQVLMISRSGYGETASWFSRALTLRLLSGKNPSKFNCNFKEGNYDGIRAYLEANDFNN